MFPLSKRWMMVAMFGHGVLFSLALIGAVRIVCLLLDVPLSERVAGNVWLISSLLLGSLFVSVYVRSLKHAQPQESGFASLGERN